MNELMKQYEQGLERIEQQTKELEATCEEIQRKYYKEPVVRIYNNMQAFKYMKNGLHPLEVYPDIVAERIVFVFRKKETQDLYQKWLAHEL